MKEFIVVVNLCIIVGVMIVGVVNINYSHMQSADYVLIIISSFITAGIVWGSIKKDNEQDSQVKPPMP